MEKRVMIAGALSVFSSFQWNEIDGVTVSSHKLLAPPWVLARVSLLPVRVYAHIYFCGLFKKKFKWSFSTIPGKGLLPGALSISGFFFPWGVASLV